MKRAAWILRLAVPMLCVCACTVTPPPQEDVAASRADVTASLYRQLELVLARQAELSVETDAAAIEERAELLRLAAEIAIRLVRIDPQADGQGLVERIEQAR